MRIMAVLALAAAPALLPAAPPDFARDIVPLLNAKCAACHDAKTNSSGFSVTTLETLRKGGKKHGPAITGGHPESSVLLKMVRGELAPRMPIGAELTPQEIALLESWVTSLPAETQIAKSDWLWPYQKPVKPQVPAGQNPIDHFIRARLKTAGIPPAPQASKTTLARRLYFDLIGLPPTPQELQSFLNDKSPNAYATLIDKLLADSRYGERWARHWLDVVRYGETSGLEGDGMIGNAWRYRDWVIDAFNADMPYDRFALLQIGGADEHSKTRNNYPINLQGHIPLGFLRVAPWDRSNLVADEVRQNYLSEVTTTTASVFLGLSVGCARCHDHKYDPIPQKDYYRLQAFFNTIQVENVEVPYKDEAFKKRAEEKIKQLQAALKDGPEKKAVDAYEAEMRPRFIAGRRKAAEILPISATDLRLEIRRKETKLFTPEERLRHADLLEDANRTQDAEEKQILEKFEAPLLARLKEKGAPPERFEALTEADLRGELARTNSKIFTAEERDKYRDLSEAVEMFRRRLARWQPTTLTVKNVPGPPNGPYIAPTRVLIRGDYRQPGEPVEAGFLSAITGNSDAAVIEQDRYRQYPTRGSRLTLARWITSPDNPLTARVMANRVWQYHFGRGIVATPSDFGANGERPTHPELLDHLAHAFIESGWSVKSLHRLILNSETYKQSAENGVHEKDADNQLLWRFPRRRLEAEEIRDSLLHLSGRLNPEMFGPSVFPPLPDDLADFARYGRGGALMWETNESEADARRRSIYTFQRRSMPLPMMAAFDAPVFSESCERRSSTTTPLQALSMMNGQLIHAESKFIAEKAGTLENAFQLILHRAPTPQEKDKFQSSKAPLDAICRVLLNANEFLYVE